jgi:hypothetical protein
VKKEWHSHTKSSSTIPLTSALTHTHTLNTHTHILFNTHTHIRTHIRTHIQVMSSYYWSDHDQGPPSTPVHGSGGSTSCGNGQAWVCEHRHTGVANMVKWRKTAGAAPVANWASPTLDQVRETLIGC